MTRFSLTIIISLFALFSFGQIKANKDSLLVNPSSIKVILLGTGTPQPIMERFGSSILVQAGSETLLFDAGRGCLQRLRQINISYDKINALFLTHLHSTIRRDPRLMAYGMACIKKGNATECIWTHRNR